MERVKHARPLFGDGVLAALLTLGGVVGTTFAGSPSRAEVPIDVRGYVLVVTAAVVLAVRRRWPQAVLAVVALCTWSYLVLGYAYGPILISFMLAVYSAARHAPLNRAVPYSLAALAMTLTHLLVHSHRLGLFGVVDVSAWVFVPFSLGFALRTRREMAVRARAEAIRQSVDDERLRVAQEVHDIVGHGLAAIKMQADVALHVLAKKPDQAEVALEAISRTSSEALDELRATLAMVRRAGTEAERSPVPSLARLDELRRRMAEAGVYVRLENSGEPVAALPVAVDLTGYRIIQESLTNVLRHSGAEQATVGIRYEPGGVLITVSNTVTDYSPGEGGSGISGMRERVLALGGEFTAGPSPDDGFEVRARLPTGGPS
ncbi:histidine kinase [Actinoallomurus bryophytorum]|uniref:sensor histidine kinase n=1 Tax=Actinoallomurus bryophytorum TaxID=1490222 RepID=UPI001C8A86F9|nr:sensor histidine kinase [Actinoallomurus bryophytorum]